MSMYNPHRGLGPNPQNARLNELLDGIRAEFESQARASGEYEHSSKYTREFMRGRMRTRAQQSTTPLDMLCNLSYDIKTFS